MRFYLRRDFMTMWKKNVLFSACALMFTACDKKADTPKADAPDTTNPAEAVKAEEPKAEDAAQDGALGAEEFSEKLAGASCQWVETCKNEELVQFLQFGAGMMISFGAMGRPDLKDEIEPAIAMFKKAEEEKRVGMSADECKTVLNLGFKLAHMDAASLKASVDAKRVTFDGEMAAQCVKGFAEEKALCSVETKVEPGKQTGFAEMQANEKKYKEGMDALTKPCDNVLTGLVADGAECTETYECMGESKCKGAPGSKPGDQKSCTAAQPAGTPQDAPK
jgi:hypothetical protein